MRYYIQARIEHRYLAKERENPRHIVTIAQIIVQQVSIDTPFGYRLDITGQVHADTDERKITGHDGQ